MNLLTRFEERREAPPPTAAHAESHKSLALNTLVQELRGVTASHVLDLGVASGSNVEFLTQFASRIQIEDLYSTLVSNSFFANRENFEPSVFRSIIGVSSAMPFDIIFGWNVFDYLDAREIRALVSHLASACRRGTFLFALSSTLKEIPVTPCNFRILNRETLVYEHLSSQLRVSPRYTPRDFTAMMQGFRVHNSYLLKNGMQEYLFVHE